MRDALYYPINPLRDSVLSQIGRTIYEEFSTVVNLKQQMRTTDPVWHEFLQHLRYGQVEEKDLKMLRTLIIGNREETIDYSTEPWKTATLVTPRHAVRTAWNESAVRKMCRETGQQLFICEAKDTIQGRPLTLREQYCLESRHKGGRNKRRAKDLPRMVEMAIWMEVMVTKRTLI
ncbi:hypothetical protein BDN70DRAFT_378676 [Pholiota conissans]|uniref:Uncharacterized protein n=1 Tax=Pholiota conissans TaxID=109636 RepID=A0A9P5Z847_9AGAR|nr:hypothetical protein BDN70DRAFT_378676 [Pholiota conissans]